MNECTNVDKETVAAWFSLDVKELKGAKILFAWYEDGGYDGTAFVLFRKNRKLYEVNGSHCSCYGLEDQWQPEETSKEALMLRQRYYYETELKEFLLTL